MASGEGRVARGEGRVGTDGRPLIWPILAYRWWRRVEGSGDGDDFPGNSVVFALDRPHISFRGNGNDRENGNNVQLARADEIDDYFRQLGSFVLLQKVACPGDCCVRLTFCAADKSLKREFAAACDRVAIAKSR